MTLLVNHHLNLTPVLYVDQLCYPRETLPVSNDHRDFYPFDQIFCPLFSGAYSHRLFAVVVPFKNKYQKSENKNKHNNIVYSILNLKVVFQ